jgi:rhamnulokinase
LLGESVAAASFTNEGGAFGTIRFLKNVMGLWILESCRKEWAAAHGEEQADLAILLRRASALDRAPALVYPDDPRFFNPTSMTAALRAAIREASTHPARPSEARPSEARADDARPRAGPATAATKDAATEGAGLADPAALTRVILDSLALRYASVVEAIERLTGQTIPGIHVVGGGCLNDYLNQATADAHRQTGAGRAGRGHRHREPGGPGHRLGGRALLGGSP